MRVILAGPGRGNDIAAALQKSRILVDHIPQPEQAQAVFPEELYNAAVFLLDGPDMVEHIHAARAEGFSVPILVVTSHASTRDRIRALDAGADDFLTRPFLMGELLARVRALSRRGAVLQSYILQAGDLTLDHRSCLLSGPAGEVRLSARELQLAELFLLHPGQILTRGLLHQKVWGCDYEPSYNELEVYLSFMRRKLRTVGSLVHIHAARGLGYYLKILDDAAPEAP